MKIADARFLIEIKTTIDILVEKKNPLMLDVALYLIFSLITKGDHNSYNWW
jgi:hypothetical protein